MRLQKQMLVSAPTEASITQNDIINGHLQNHYNNIISQNFEKTTTNFKIFEIDVFSQVKEMLDIRQTLEYYGVSVNSKHFALCPFHEEKTPSFKVYDDSFYCFGCGESGTVIDFTMKYFGLTVIDAVKKLNEDFRLDVELWGGKLPPNRLEKIRDNKSLVSDFVAWEKRAYSILARRFREIHERSKTILAPNAPNLWEHVAELAEMDFVGWLCDIMIENMHNFAAQVEFYSSFRGEVEAIERKFSHQ